MAEQQRQYPEGKALEVQITKRHRSGSIGRTLFQASTIIGILALTALLYNIINETFGTVAVQNSVEPDKLVLDVEEAKLLEAPGAISSEDDNELAEGIGNDALGIGFFGYAYYAENSDRLKILSVDGVTASAETVSDGSYPMSRPLFMYTTAEVLQNNQAASIYLNYLLTHINEEIDQIGYFPISQNSLAAAQTAWVSSSGFDLQPGQWAIIDPAGFTGTIHMAGSSTVFPIADYMTNQIQDAEFAATVNIDSVGSTAGFRMFCEELSTDIANASRPITPAEYKVCQDNNLRPIELRVGTDALAVVVSRENEFLNNVTVDELKEIFTTAVNWSDVNPAWPNEPINRYIPGADSGTLDFFAETVFPTPLEELPQETLVEILQANITVGLGRNLERQQRFFDDVLMFEDPDLFAEVCASDDPPKGCTAPARDQKNVYDLLIQEVVQPDVLQTWSLFDSILHQSEIAAYAKEAYPNAELEFRSWISPSFLVSPQSSTPEFAGVRTAILGSLWVVLITVLFSFPVGVAASIYLEEYAEDNVLNRIIQTNINNLAGVPSIIYGMLGLVIFVRALEVFSSGALFGLVDDSTTANGRTIISAGLTLGLLILPIIIINSQEAIRAVPHSLRQAGMALGATKWQTIWHHVIPNALPGILTGTILAIARAIGETAPLVVVGASTFITVDPGSPFSKFTVLPIQIYQWTSRPQAEFRNIAAAAIIVLLVLLLSLNASAVYLRNRYSRRA